MALQCGIVGLPNVGKSTLFNCLSNAKAQSANFPFCTIEPNVGIITVPDERLIKLGELCKPVRGIIPTTVEIVDIWNLCDVYLPESLTYDKIIWAGPVCSFEFFMGDEPCSVQVCTKETFDRIDIANCTSNSKTVRYAFPIGIDTTIMCAERLCK